MFKKEKNKETLSPEKITELVTKIVAKTMEEMLKKGTISTVNDAPQVEIPMETEVKDAKSVAPKEEKTDESPKVKPVEVEPNIKNAVSADIQPMLEKITGEINLLSNSFNKMSDVFEEFSYKEKINKELHEDLQKYKEGLKESFISPLLKSIVREYDNNVKQYQAYFDKSVDTPQTELFRSLLKEFQMSAESILILLNDYNLEPFSFEEGATFSSTGGEQKITELIETTDSAKDGKVALCTACGFRNMETGKIFRKAEVKIFKVKQA
ncbi:MAG: hypothetical protein LBC98_04225 [Prevotellaceae bacterium]|nr:hypothetical protein [Prevotellaceae bacterium]